MKSTLAVAVLLAATAGASGGVTTFIVTLDGFQEVNAGGMPNQGDLDGSGIATLMIDDSVSPPQIDWNFVVNGITLPLTLAHIHQAPAGSNGPVVVDFSAQLSGSGLADADLVNVLANPSNFYVNLHNVDFPGGALRGQIPAPGSVALVAAAGLMGLRRRR